MKHTEKRGYMSEVNVELVKYDTKKTKKRKRSNLTVSARTEAAVIEKLERIHKNDKVESVHEIIWGNEIIKDPSKEKEERAVFRGTVKFYDPEKGFGFIKSSSDKEDLFFHSSGLKCESLLEDDIVDFEMGQGSKGPTAIQIRLVED